ncbi:MAG: peroxiredoxin [Candidatus Peribacteraceae bacterium]
MLTPPTPSPHWHATDDAGVSHSSESSAGSWLILYFYPKDDTPGCTIQACGFQKSSPSFAGRARILGVSRDDQESHVAFREKYGLGFPLLIDTDGSLHTTFGVGTDYPKRTTFLIDPTGTIQKIYHGFDCNDHAADLLRGLDELGA